MSADTIFLILSAVVPFLGLSAILFVYLIVRRGNQDEETVYGPKTEIEDYEDRHWPSLW